MSGLFLFDDNALELTIVIILIYILFMIKRFESAVLSSEKQDGINHQGIIFLMMSSFRKRLFDVLSEQIF